MVNVTIGYAIYSKKRKQFKGKTERDWTDEPIRIYRTRGHAVNSSKHISGAYNSQWNPIGVELAQKKLDDLVIVDLAIHWEVP